MEGKKNEINQIKSFLSSHNSAVVAYFWRKKALGVYFVHTILFYEIVAVVIIIVVDVLSFSLPVSW